MHADHQKRAQRPVRLAPSVHFFSSKNPPIWQPEVEVALAGGRSVAARPARVCRAERPALELPVIGTATNATSHDRRSFLVVMAASWRSRQRPSPLRGGRGGGLCPFVVVTAEVFYTSTQKQRKKTLHMRLPPFLSQEPAWGLRLFTALAPPGDFFGEIIEKKKKKAEKKPPPLAVGGGHVAVFAAPPWRSRRSFADTAGGLSWRSFLVFQFGG